MNVVDQAKEASEKVNVTIQNVQRAPRWKLYIIGAVILLIVSYLAWSIYGKKPVALQKDFVAAHTSAPVADLEKKQVAAPAKLLVYDKATATKKLDLPPTDARDEVVAAVDVKPGRKAAGSRVVTFTNTSTGESRSITQDIPRPWASFERGNEVSAGYGISRDGAIYAVKYKRDIARIGSIYLSGEVEANQTPLRTEGKAMLWGSYRW